MIENITDDMIHKSYWLLTESPEYVNKLTRTICKDDILKKHLVNIEYHLSSAALIPSYFIIDTFRLSNSLYSLSTKTYASIRDEMQHFDDPSRAKHMNVALAYIIENNELYALKIMQLCTTYKDDAESMIVFKLLESQYYESIDKKLLRE